jgi:hypothetical protein
MGARIRRYVEVVLSSIPGLLAMIVSLRCLFPYVAHEESVARISNTPCDFRSFPLKVAHIYSVCLCFSC